MQGETAHNANNELIIGTMPNNGLISEEMDGIETKTINIPAGYTEGGTVSLDNTIDNIVDTQSDLITQIRQVADNLPESSGRDPSIEDAFITRTFITYTNDRVTTIGQGAFYGCDSLTSVNFPVCKTIGEYAFTACTALTTVNFPVCETIGVGAFELCHSLEAVIFPKCTTVGIDAFTACTALTTVNFPVCTTIDNGVFRNCYNLLSLYLRASTVCTLSNSDVFYSTPIKGYTEYTNGVLGSIFVPASLVNTYKTATNWTYFANRIFAIPTFTFTIKLGNKNNIVECQAEEGMTWEEWVNSEYNTNESLKICGDYAAYEDEYGPYALSSNFLNANKVYKTDLIQSEHLYYISDHYLG